MSFPSQLLQIHNRVLELCNICQLISTPVNPLSSNRDIAQKIINDLTQTISYIISTKELQNQYKKLEQSIQKKEADIRKHIGLEQQLKLYSQSLEQQLDESQLARSEFIQKSRKMLSDLKRSNHFLHEQNLNLKDQLSLFFDDDKTRKKTFNIDVDLKKHMRTQSSKDQIQKTPSRQKFAEVYNKEGKKSGLIKTKMDMRELLTSVQRKREIQKKIKQLNQKRTIDEVKIEKLNSNSSYHELYSRNVEGGGERREKVGSVTGGKHDKKVQGRSSIRKNNSSKKSYGGDDDLGVYEKIHYKTRSINKDI